MNSFEQSLFSRVSDRVFQFRSHSVENILTEISATLSTSGEPKKDRVFWKLLGEQWDRLETTFQASEIIGEALRRFSKSKRYAEAARASFMEPRERKALRRLAAHAERHSRGEVLVYRGISVAPGEMPDERGMSWTLSSARAAWFANYANSPRRLFFGSDPGECFLLMGYVRHRDIIGIKLERRESEVVVVPESVVVEGVNKMD